MNGNGVRGRLEDLSARVGRLAWWRHLALSRAASLLCEASRIPSYRRQLPLLGAELTRARRYRRPLSVAVLRIDDGDAALRTTPREAPILPAPQMLFFALGLVLQDCLRQSDLVVQLPGDRFLALFTEATAAQAREATRRIEGRFRERVPASLGVGIAEFPADGFTLDALVSTASQQAGEDSERHLAPAALARASR